MGKGDVSIFAKLQRDRPSFERKFFCFYFFSYDKLPNESTVEFVAKFVAISPSARK